jgi:N-acetylglucosamine kinase-like BadF-type ATPase
MGLKGQPGAALDLPDLVIGVDGGQTALKCALATRDVMLLGQGQGGGLLHLAQDGGPERFQQALAEALRAAWMAAGLEPRPVAALVMGLTGVTSASTPEAALAVRLAGGLIEAAKIVADNDALAALKGAHAGGPGIISIAGTGSITLGINRRGRLERAGGWGWLLGDEGSAFWIGREGLRAAMRAQEGLGPATVLLPAFQTHFQAEELIQVKRVVFSAGFGAQGFAALAPLVAAAAENGDTAAGDILRQAGQDLAASVRAVANRLDFGLDPVPVAPVGGAFEHFPGLRRSFEAHLGEADRFAVAPPLYPPVMGAVIMACQLVAQMNTQETP